MSKTEIKLVKGVEINGATIKTLTMREPTVGDQIDVSEMKGSDAAQEVALFANLCEITPADVRSMSMKDYHLLRDAYRAFID